MVKIDTSIASIHKYFLMETAIPKDMIRPPWSITIDRKTFDIFENGSIGLGWLIFYCDDNHVKIVNQGNSLWTAIYLYDQAN